MPIIIKKGSDQNKKQVLNAYRTSESTESIKVEPGDASDMTDILNFRVYRVSKPNFYDNSVQTHLVGDLFYDDDELLNVQEAVSATVSSKEVLPSQIVSIAKFKKENPVSFKPSKKEVLLRVKALERRTLLAKCGHSLENHLQSPSLEHTLSWAVKHVNTNEDSLLNAFINLDAFIKSYEAEHGR